MRWSDFKESNTSSFSWSCRITFCAKAAEVEKMIAKTTRLAAINKDRRSFSDTTIINLRQKIRIFSLTIAKYLSIITPPCLSLYYFYLKSATTSDHFGFFCVYWIVSVLF
jgi:hypothetical protein